MPAAIVFGKHPVGFSVINMELKSDSLFIDYSIRIFKDDYFSLIDLLYYDALHSKEPSAITDTAIIEKYFTDNFFLETDEGIVSPAYLGSQSLENDLWLYFRIKLNKLPAEVFITNKIFNDISEDQLNLLIISCGEKEKGLTFDTKTTRQLFSFKNIY